MVKWLLNDRLNLVSLRLVELVRLVTEELLCLVLLRHELRQLSLVLGILLSWAVDLRLVVHLIGLVLLVTLVLRLVTILLLCILILAIVVLLSHLRVLICSVVILLIKIGRHRHLRLHLYLSFSLVNLHLGRAVDQHFLRHGWHRIGQPPQILCGVREAAQVSELT